MHQENVSYGWGQDGGRGAPEAPRRLGEEAQLHHAAPGSTRCTQGTNTGFHCVATASRSHIVLSKVIYRRKPEEMLS